MALVDIEKLTTGTKQKAQKKAEIDISWRRLLKVSGKNDKLSINDTRT